MAHPIHQDRFIVETDGRGTTDITRRIDAIVGASALKAGVATVFVHHTSASLIVCENADPSVRSDLERFFAKLVPDGSPLFQHTAEGPDDMSAHVRSVLTQTSLQVPVAGGRCDLGTWQGIYLWEHRAMPHRRRVTVTVLGN